MKKLILASFVMAACVSSDKSASTDTATFTQIGSATDTSPAPSTTPPADSSVRTPEGPPPASPEPSTWQVTSAGIGPIRAGMTLAEANTASGNRLIIGEKLQECDYVRIKGAPAGISLMVQKGRISRAEVREGTTQTAEGARIGDTEARIKSLYPGLEVQRHKYTDGHYLVVTPGQKAGSNNIVFETDGKKVLKYRSGVEPAVQYVEGCS